MAQVDDTVGGPRTGEALARLEERTQHISTQMNNLISQLNSNFVTQAEFRPLKTSLDELNKSGLKDFVTQAEFTPVKNIVYGMISLIVVTVLGSLIALVLKKGV